MKFFDLVPINVAGLFGGLTMSFVAPFFLYMYHHGWFWRRSDVDNSIDWLKVWVTAVLGICLALYPICLTGIIYQAVQK